MAKKKKKNAPTPTTPAVPPPDNPLLRHLAEEAPLGGGIDERQMARARAKAIRQAKQMADSDHTETKPDGDKG
jgi:hypothetical protein